MINSRSIFVAANGTVSFFLMAGERSIVYLCQAGIHGDTGRGAPKESVTGRDLRAQQRHVRSGGQPRGALSGSGQLPGAEAGSRGGCRVTRIAQVMRMWTRADTKAGQGHEGPGLSPMGRRLGEPGVPAPPALARAGVCCRPPVSFLWVKWGDFFIETLLPFSSSSP